MYQIIFDNYYSWFTSKDVNYRIALLKLNDKPNKNLGEGEKKEEKQVEAGAGLVEGDGEGWEEGSQVEVRLFLASIGWGSLIQVQA